MSLPTYSSEIVDAALCIWECALQNCPEDRTILNWLQQDEGAATGRDGALTIAPFAEHAWKRAQSLGYDEAFDWEFVPRFLTRARRVCEAPSDMDNAIAYIIGGAIDAELASNPTTRPPTIPEIHAQQSAYVRNSGITIETVSLYGQVTIADDAGNNVFLHGTEGSAFLSKARRLWNTRGDITMTEANEITAYPYADLLAEIGAGQ